MRIKTCTFLAVFGCWNAAHADVSRECYVHTPNSNEATSCEINLLRTEISNLLQIQNRILERLSQPSQLPIIIRGGAVLENGAIDGLSGLRRVCSRFGGELTEIATFETEPSILVCQ